MEIKIESLKDAEKYIQILFEKNGFTNQNILDEITHLRSELKTEIAATNKRLDATNEKLDENTLATKVLEKKLDALNENVVGGFDNIGKILQEISNKLD